MIYLFLALFAGALLPVQAAINSSLRAPLGNSVWPVAVSICVSALSLAIYALVVRLPLPATLGGIAPWQWTGGALGAFYLCMIVVLTPKLGAATTFGFIVCGQLLMSLVLDHFGWLGVPQHSLNVPRILGALFLGCGVLLIRRF